MTRKDILRVVTRAAKQGRVIGFDQAMMFLQAKEMLRDRSGDAYEQKMARTVIENFTHFLKTGERRSRFAEFLLPLPENLEDLEELST